MKNIQRHDRSSARRPPIGGAMMGAARPGQVSTAIAPINSALGVVRRTARRPTGTIIAPPKPCRMRAATKLGSLVDTPLRTEPTVKTTIAPENTDRVPSRSAAQPLGKMKTATVSR